MAWKADTRITRSEHGVSAEIDDDVVALNCSTGGYLIFNGTSAWIWSEVADRVTLRDLIQAAVQEFGVPRSTCAPDIVSCLETMRQHGLLEVDPACFGSESAPTGG